VLICVLGMVEVVACRGGEQVAGPGIQGRGHGKSEITKIKML